MSTTYVPKVFVSCSLRTEDKPFVDFVCSILKIFNTEPFGTVGKFSASPENPVSLMKKNIEQADLVVVCATTRYLMKDIGTNTISKGLSEMIHVETGMAIAHGKPVIVFVQKGAQVGSVIPNVTQYVTLDGTKDDYIAKRPLITSLFNNARAFVKKTREDNDGKALRNFAVAGLATYGAFKIADWLLTPPPQKRKRKAPQGKKKKR